jgi:Cu(I)/Ag(I) efflux system membrane fusion protein
MKKTNLILCAGVILAIGLSLPGCRNYSAQETKAEAAAESTPSSITLTPEAVKTAGIQTAEAVIRPFVRTIHAPGEIIFDPKRMSHVTARAAGRIEQVLAYHGERVQNGQVLLTLYSQDFLALQAELFQASDRLKRLESAPADRAAAQSLFDSVKNKLRLLDIPDAELSEIEKTATPKTLLPVRAPLSGSIIECSITSGDYVELGASLFRIGDISTVWVDIHIFEKDLARFRTGCEAVIRVGAYPGREFKGRFFQVGNVVDEKTRTVEGRIELLNPDGQLKPGMYIDADILSSVEANSLFVPGAAVQDYQNKKVVFVRTGENMFALRQIETGISLDGFVEILKGLKEHELVATNGSFFLKSELLKKSLGEE